MTGPEIKDALHRTWIPFFSRFGRLTRIQRQVIPLVLAGKNVVAISPSASGKTEAIVAPVIEQLLAGCRRGLSVLYISPTRALVNDLYRRLWEPMVYLGLSVARKTGDRPEFDERRAPFMLITTPESLDSLLCRHPQALQGLQVVILDELHLLDNTPRGDQIRVLLERLRLICTGLRFHALSATIEDEQIGERYFADATVVRVDETRAIDYLLLRNGPDVVKRLYSELTARGLDKVLCFFNARSHVESFSRRLDRPPFAGKVWVHHASLTRKMRETTEQLMTSEKRGVLCATSTLELGIDIGDIDAVVLFRPPFSVSSLLQRVGRGNRRHQDRLFAIGIYESDWERLLFETFFDCARQGRLYEKKYRACLSVLPQQTISYLYQRRRIGTTWDSLTRILKPLNLEPEVLHNMFAYLIDQGCVTEVRPGIYYISQALEQEIARGKIHSNIQEKSFGDYEIVESETGQIVGRIFFLFNKFSLGGRTWQVIERREKEKRAYVRCLGKGEAAVKVFEGTGTGGYYYRFAQQLKRRLFPDLADEEFPYYRSKSCYHVYHLLGELYGALLQAAWGEQGEEILDVGGRLFIGNGTVCSRTVARKSFPAPGATALRKVISKQLGMLADRLGSGAFFHLLPEKLQIEDHYRALDIPGLLDFLRRIRLVEIPAPEPM